MTKKRHLLARRLLLSLLALLTATMAWADNVTVTSETTSWTDGNMYIVTSDVTISSRISVSGTVKLDINEGATLTASQGINVPEGTTLTIKAELSMQLLKILIIQQPLVEAMAIQRLLNSDMALPAPSTSL